MPIILLLLWSEIEAKLVSESLCIIYMNFSDTILKKIIILIIYGWILNWKTLLFVTKIIYFIRIVTPILRIKSLICFTSVNLLLDFLFKRWLLFDFYDSILFDFYDLFIHVIELVSSMKEQWKKMEGDHLCGIHFLILLVRHTSYAWFL